MQWDASWSWYKSRKSSGSWLVLKISSLSKLKKLWRLKIIAVLWRRKIKNWVRKKKMRSIVRKRRGNKTRRKLRVKDYVLQDSMVRRSKLANLSKKNTKTNKKRWEVVESIMSSRSRNSWNLSLQARPNLSLRHKYPAPSQSSQRNLRTAQRNNNKLNLRVDNLIAIKAVFHTKNNPKIITSSPSTRLISHNQKEITREARQSKKVRHKSVRKKKAQNLKINDDGILMSLCQSLTNINRLY